MKKINSTKRRKNGLKKAGSPGNGKAVAAADDQYRHFTTTVKVDNGKSIKVDVIINGSLVREIP